MLRAIMIKKSTRVSLMIILMVMTYIIPSGFHLDFCNGEEGHWGIAAADCNDADIFSGHEGEENLSLAVDDCCAGFSNCNNEISCRPALLRTNQTSVSAPDLLYFTQPVATFLVSDNKTLNHIFLQSEIHSGKLSVLRTIIIQV